jgi:hypothetical protein
MEGQEIINNNTIAASDDKVMVKTRSICKSIAYNIKNMVFLFLFQQQIKKNKTWASGKCAQEYFDCDVSYHNMKVNDKRIVMYEKGWGHFKVFNRQTMELELVSVCPQQPVYTFSVKLWSILSCRFYHTK